MMGREDEWRVMFDAFDNRHVPCPAGYAYKNDG
jgi:hypothetical protein